VRGLGLDAGGRTGPEIKRLPGNLSKTQSVRFVSLLHAAGVLTIPRERR